MSDLPDPDNWFGHWKSVSDNPNALVNIGFPPDFPVLGFERASKVEFYPTKPPFYSILIFIIVEFSSTEAAEAVFATYENLVAESPHENAYSVSVGEESFGITREGCPQDSVVFRNGNVIGTVAMCGDNVEVGETILRAEFLDTRIWKNYMRPGGTHTAEYVSRGFGPSSRRPGGSGDDIGNLPQKDDDNTGSKLLIKRQRNVRG